MSSKKCSSDLGDLHKKKNLEHLLSNRFRSIVKRAKQRNLECNITEAYLEELWYKQKGICALSGIKMTYSSQRRIPTSVSVDRIDSTKGYIKGNLQLVCYICNQMKSNLTLDELLNFCNLIINYNNENKNNKSATKI